MTESNNTVGAQPYNYQQVAITKIITPPGRRSPEPTQVAALAQSIKEVGQLQPIALTPDFRLIYGGTRKAACELLGHETIQTIILDLDDLHAELAEIDENIERRTLTIIEEAQTLARRKKIYAALHPEAQPVTKQGGPGRGNKTNDKVSPVSFAADAAKKTGRSARTIQRKVAIGEKLDSEAADMLRGTKYENSQSVLKRLADFPIQKQRVRAKELKGITCSMSRRGCCYDNAVMERFFWSLKHEWTNHERFANLEEARLSVFRYIETFLQFGAAPRNAELSFSRHLRSRKRPGGSGVNTSRQESASPGPPQVEQFPKEAQWSEGKLRSMYKEVMEANGQPEREVQRRHKITLQQYAELEEKLKREASRVRQLQKENAQLKSELDQTKAQLRELKKEAREPVAA